MTKPQTYVVQLAIAAVSFFALGLVSTLAQRIKKNRRYKKTCAQIGWTPQFERRSLFNRK